MTHYYATEAQAIAEIPKAREVMAFSEHNTFKVEQFSLFGIAYPFTISMFSTQGNFAGYY